MMMRGDMWGMWIELFGEGACMLAMIIITSAMMKTKTTKKNICAARHRSTVTSALMPPWMMGMMAVSLIVIESETYSELMIQVINNDTGTPPTGQQMRCRESHTGVTRCDVIDRTIEHSTPLHSTPLHYTTLHSSKQWDELRWDGIRLDCVGTGHINIISRLSHNGLEVTWRQKQTRPILHHHVHLSHSPYLTSHHPTPHRLTLHHTHYTTLIHPISLTTKAKQYNIMW